MRYFRWHEINSVGIDLDDLRAARIEPLNHLLKQIAPDLRHTRGSVEVGEMSLRESEIAVETVQQNFKRVLQRLKMVLLGGILFRAHFRFCLQAKRAEIRQQMPKDLELVRCGKTVELQHHRWIQRSDVESPHVTRHTDKKNVGVTALEC